MMDMKTYFEIVGIIRRFRGLSKNCLEKLTRKFDKINHDTLYSILSLEYQKRMKANHIKSPTNINKYWSAYKSRSARGDSPGIIVRIAEEFEICPCLIAKLILQKYFEANESRELNKMNRFLRDTTLIPDGKLAHEVFLCTLYDNLYSPISETMKHSLGQEYEIKLYKEIVALGLAFRGEEHLRKYGYDKTPDVKLDVPVAIDGVVINWIESKALFADEDVHREYKKNQYLSYWNRFGPGLVIYWFGFTSNIANVDDRKFIVRDNLPSKIVCMDV